MTSNNELRELAAKPTPGPWWVDSHGHRMCANGGMDTVFIASEKMGEAKRHPETGNLSHWPNDWDASYIAAANPARILSLLDEVEAIQAECEKLRTELGQYRTSKPVLLLFSRVPRYQISKGQAEDGWGRSTGYIRVDEDPAGEFMRTDDVRRLLIQPLLEQPK